MAPPNEEAPPPVDKPTQGPPSVDKPTPGDEL